MSVIMSLFLGLVQGIAEFLPISSSGHIAILQNLFSGNNRSGSNMFFDVLLHLGTLISVCAVYRADIKSMISDGVDFIRARSDADQGEPVTLKPHARTLLFVIIGTVPMLIAVFFIGAVSILFSKIGFIGFALIITGGLLFVSDKLIKRGNKTEKTMTVVDALIIGLAQAVAIIPGLSRSGTTIVVGLSRGLSGSFAVRFSFLLSIPAVFAAMIVEIVRAIRGGVDFSLLPTYLAGFVIAVVVGFFAIQVISRLISKSGFGKFAYYCWGIGLVAIIIALVK